jgi:sugar phosphate permease
VWLVTTLFSGLVAIFMTFVTVAARRRGLPHPAMLWLAYAGAAAVVRTLGSGLPDRVGPRNLIVPAVASYVLAFVVAADARTEAAFWMAGALAGLGHGYGFPVLVTQTVDRTPEHLRGSTFALYTALWALSSLVLTPVFGQIADWSDDATMFSLAALCGVVLLALWVPLETLLARPAGAPSANAPPRC